jgi:ribosomal protein S18 acetylase RimI-like enzyme
MTLMFRPAAAADVPDLVALIESAYRGDSSRAGWTTEADLLGGQRTDAMAVGAVVHGERSVMLAAEDDGQLVGCCQIERRDAGQAYFGMFSVRPGLQGHGWGREILTEAERRARDVWGATTMVMTVLAQRPDLIAWYERRGYHLTGESRPFPYGNARYGLPKVPDLRFVTLAKPLTDTLAPVPRDGPRSP